MLLLGTYFRKLDRGRRVAIPKKLLKQFNGEVALLGLSPDGCICIFPREGKNANKANLRKVCKISLFYNKRLVIPKKIFNSAGLREKVIVAGCGNYIEIWDNEEWVKIMQKIKNNKETQRVLSY